MKLLLLSLLSSAVLFAQSFYVLSGVDNYDPLVLNTSSKTQQYTKDIKSLMESMSQEIGVDTTGHPSRVLYFVISDTSLGDIIGLKVDFQLGEYVLREGESQSIFGVTYADIKLLAPDFNDKEDVEDQLADTIEDMLEKFKLQFQEDNKEISKGKIPFTHETFAKDMGYETNYNIALTKAKKEGKQVMLFMTTSYCPWCRKLESRLLSQIDIDKKIKDNYIPLTLNLDTDTYPEQFSKTRFTPILYIVDEKSEKIEHIFEGYNNRGDFIRLLNEK